MAIIHACCRRIWLRGGIYAYCSVLLLLFAGCEKNSDILEGRTVRAASEATDRAGKKVVFRFEVKTSTTARSSKRSSIDDYLRMIQKRLDSGGHCGASVRATGPTTFDVVITDRATLSVERIMRRVISHGYFWIAPLASDGDDPAALARAGLVQGQSVIQDGLELAAWIPIEQSERGDELLQAGVVMRASGQHKMSALRWKTSGLVTQMGVQSIGIDTIGERATAIRVSLSVYGRESVTQIIKHYGVGTQGSAARYIGFEFDGTLLGFERLEARSPDVLTFRTSIPIDEAEDMVAVVMAYPLYSYSAIAVGWSVPSVVPPEK